jgi:hypothetical protein
MVNCNFEGRMRPFLVERTLLADSGLSRFSAGHWSQCRARLVMECPGGLRRSFVQAGFWTWSAQRVRKVDLTMTT